MRPLCEAYINPEGTPGQIVQSMIGAEDDQLERPITQERLRARRQPLPIVPYVF